MPQLFLYFLLFSSISAFPLDLERNETCLELKERFMHQFNSAVSTDSLYSSLASHLAIKCRRVMLCEQLGGPSPSLDHPSDIPLSENLCKTLELVSGPVGECLDYIRDEYDDSEVMDCVRKERKNDGLGEAKKPLSAALDRLFNFEYSCDSLFHNCTKSVITSECSPLVWRLLQEHRDLLMSTNCAGTEIFQPSKLEFYEAIHGMTEKIFGELIKELEADKGTDKDYEIRETDKDLSDAEIDSLMGSLKKRIEDDEDDYEEEEFGKIGNKKKKHDRHSIDDY